MSVLLGAGDLVAEVDQPVAEPVRIAAESLEEVGAQLDREEFGEPQGVLVHSAAGAPRLRSPITSTHHP
ncbi:MULTISPECIES: hypothetical protein [Streptomyces]|uniref:hypothetical protein n=1 Tax=Streptomyces TaxID=1883 RepID=UPI0016780DF6|nr:hypothetical protein [Streptomyces canarius]